MRRIVSHLLLLASCSVSACALSVKQDESASGAGADPVAPSADGANVSSDGGGRDASSQDDAGMADAPSDPIADFPAPARDDVIPRAGCWSVSKDAMGQAPLGKRFVDPALKRPVPTHQFWAPLFWHYDDGDAFKRGRQTSFVHVHPFVGALVRRGLSLMHSPLPQVNRWDAPLAEMGSFAYRFVPPAIEENGRHDVVVSMQGLDADAMLEDFSAWTATGVWRAGDKALHATLVKGAPYVFFTAEGGDVVVELGGNQRKVFAETGGALGISIDGRAYGVFGPSDASWQKSDGQLRSSLSGKGYLAIAALPKADAESFELFRKHAYNFVTAGQVTFGYDEARSKVITRFHAQVTRKESTPDLSEKPLLGLYPHQWRHSNAVLLSHEYASPRGRLRLFEGDSFETELSYHGVLPELPLVAPADDKLKQLLEAPERAAGMTSAAYFGPTEMAKVVHLAQIADQLGDTQKRDAFLQEVRSATEDWFSKRGDQDQVYFRYFSEWQTMTGFPAQSDMYTDTMLNDKHFDDGYMLQAAVGIGLTNPAWARDEGYGGMVKQIVRDTVNPLSDDPEFPALRTFDAYEGHSWALGHGNFDVGGNQESSSEAMQLSAMLVLWGELTHNKTLRDLGVWLYTSEAVGIEEYWFDAHHDVFPKEFQSPLAGMVWSGGANYSTWFSADPEAMLGINLLPFHGGSLYLAQMKERLADALEQTDARIEKGLGSNNWRNEDVLALGRSLVDPASALARFDASSGYTPQTGETRAHTYFWLTNMAALGNVSRDVTADIATYAVFDGPSGRSHVAFNADCTNARKVRFSDGTELEVPAHTMLVERAGITLLRYAPGGADACASAAPSCM